MKAYCLDHGDQHTRWSDAELNWVCNKGKDCPILRATPERIAQIQHESKVYTAAIKLDQVMHAYPHSPHIWGGNIEEMHERIEEGKQRSRLCS